MRRLAGTETEAAVAAAPAERRPRCSRHRCGSWVSPCWPEADSPARRCCWRCARGDAHRRAAARNRYRRPAPQRQPRCGVTSFCMCGHRSRDHGMSSSPRPISASAMPAAVRRYVIDLAKFAAATPVAGGESRRQTVPSGAWQTLPCRVAPYAVATRQHLPVGGKYPRQNLPPAADGAKRPRNFCRDLSEMKVFAPRRGRHGACFEGGGPQSGPFIIPRRKPQNV